ncbi:MAG: two-component system response regulator [Ekhidna sp.]
MSQGLKKIVLIDDDSTTNFLNKTIIQKAGLVDEIMVFEEAEEALTYFKSKNSKDPFLVLLDVNMPIMNGWEFLDEYDKIKNDLNAFIVMLTSSIDPADKQKAESFNYVVEYQSKPLSNSTINKLVETYFK